MLPLVTGDYPQLLAVTTYQQLPPNTGSYHELPKVTANYSSYH